MEKANGFYKQPKMKQKDYFEALKRQQSLEHLYDGIQPKSLHQLKQKRGSMVQRSFSDVTYRRKERPTFDAPTPSSSSSNNTNNKYVGTVVPSVKRSYSDSVRLVHYKDNRNGSIRTNFVRSRPSSVDLGWGQQQQQVCPQPRPASVDFTHQRPRSILKKSSSFNDLNNNPSLEEDFIFDEEYLDYVSPRDILSKSGHGDRTAAQNLNFSFEDEISNQRARQTRPLSPKTAKHVNFDKKLTYFKTSPRGGSKATDNIHNNHVSPQIRSRSDAQPRGFNDAEKYSQKVTKKHKDTVSPNQVEFYTENALHDGSLSEPHTNNKNYPLEIRKPMFAENNVVDFGTFISKKLAKLKFKNRRKETVTKESDGNFTLLPNKMKAVHHKDDSPKRKDDFMNQEVLY